jgi:rSAM/selenodomain-associated transferase 1
MRGRIAIFARAPVPGQAKTRLVPALGANGAAALQAALIRHTLQTAFKSGATTELWCHPDVHHPLFKSCAQEYGVICHQQQGEDLGARMRHAADASPGPVVLIGTDCPTLLSEDLTAALDGLEEFDAVLGPAADGGYYLLGLNCSARPLFEGVAWGTDRVLAVTRDRLAGLGWRWKELGARHDIDRPEDLVHLPKSLHLPTE